MDNKVEHESETNKTNDSDGESDSFTSVAIDSDTGEANICDTKEANVSDSKESSDSVTKESSDTEAKESSDTETKESSDTETKEASDSDLKVKNVSDTKVVHGSDNKVEEVSQTKVKQETNTKSETDSNKKVANDSEMRVQQDSDTKVDQDSDIEVVYDFDLKVAHDFDAIERTDDVKTNKNVTFESMCVRPHILEGLTKAGFKRPSPIQLAAIPLVRIGLDAIVQAKSGTGKTLVFVIAALELTETHIRRTQVLILAPTKEIAVQIAGVIRTITTTIKKLRTQVFVGGTSIKQDKESFRSGCHIAVGTPGKVRHLIQEEIFDTSAVRLLVLDEADQLFSEDCSFQNDINFIFNKCCESKQILAISATFTPELLEFTKKYMRNGGRHVTPESDYSSLLRGIKQFVLITPNHTSSVKKWAAKEEELFKLMSAVPYDLCCIFHNFASCAESQTHKLNKRGHKAVYLSGKLELEERLEAIAKIRTGEKRLLVTTDVAARGVDFKNLNLVINMGIPRSMASYLHRMGRSGRYGTSGICISIISEGEELVGFRKMLGQISKETMQVYVIPKEKTFDLWNDNLAEYEKVEGMIQTTPPNVETTEDSGAQSDDETSESVENIELEDSMTDDEEGDNKTFAYDYEQPSNSALHVNIPSGSKSSVSFDEQNETLPPGVSSLPTINLSNHNVEFSNVVDSAGNPKQPGYKCVPERRIDKFGNLVFSSRNYDEATDDEKDDGSDILKYEPEDFAAGESSSSEDSEEMFFKSHYSNPYYRCDYCPCEDRIPECDVLRSHSIESRRQNNWYFSMVNAVEEFVELSRHYRFMNNNQSF